MKKLAAAALAAIALAAAAAPMSPERLPDTLRPWVGWVMHGQEMSACPPAFNDPKIRSCVWPGELGLELAEAKGTFRLRADVFAPDSVLQLPGDAEHWPQDVRLDGKTVAVVAVQGKPALRLPPGRFQITGILPWKSIPQSIVVPVATGVLKATLNGAPLSSIPDGEGRLWLNRTVEANTENTLSIRTFRHFADGVPLRSTVRYELTVAGKPREIALPGAVLATWIPMSIDSPLPVKIDAAGNASVQVRAGTWQVGIGSRRMEPAREIALGAEASGEEVWSFQANNDVRVVTAQGLPAVDPRNVGTPAGWRSFPAFLARPGSVLKLTETRRGNAEGNTDKIALARTFWMDFDGDGYTIQDRLTGTLGRTWRLSLPPPFQLGRAAVSGDDQAITVTKDQVRGIELRDATLALEADSRIASSSRTLPVSGWQADVTGWTGVLHLPPGWRLLHVAGVDRVHGAWSANWSLWDFFFVAIVVAGAFRVFGVAAAGILAIGLVLSWHNRDIPVLPWIGIVITAALAGALPEGRLRTWTNRARSALAIVAGLLLIPFAVTQVRLALYPALGFYGDPVTSQNVAQTVAPPPVPAAAGKPAHRPGRKMDIAPQANDEAVAEMEEDKRKEEMLSRDNPIQEFGNVAQSNLPGLAKSYRRYQQIDPQAKNLTGPGVPRWSAQTFRMSIQGPIVVDQTLRFVVLPPWANALWGLGALLGLALSLWLTAGISPSGISERLKRVFGRASAAGLLAFVLLGQAPDSFAAKEALPPAESSGTPPATLLDELRNRLSSPPACMPACAELARLSIAAKGQRILLGVEIHAQATVAVPLPGQGARARPGSVSAGAAAVALRRDEAGTLWATVREGVTDIAIEINAEGASEIPVVLPLAPRQITHELSEWTLAGLDARGLATGSIQLVRQAAATGRKPTDPQRHDTLPPLVRIERTISLAQTWTTTTRIVRETNRSLPVTVRVPLLPGEAVTDAAILTENGEAIVELGQGAGASFAGSLQPGAEIRLRAGRHAGQIEQWLLDVSPQWHVTMKGIPPVSQQRGAEWMPSWSPWPGEEVTLSIDKPAAIDGATMTFDTVLLSSVIGKRTSDLAAEIRLRAGTGGNHTFTLPQNAQLLRVLSDGAEQPLRAEGRKLTVPVTPGARTLKIEWRDAAGISGAYSTPEFGLGLPAVNAFVDIRVPQDRVTLLTSGPVMGPAVLFWGVLIVTLGLAVLAGRYAESPLRTTDWILLGFGLVQSSVAATAVVVGWFLVLAYRKRAPEIASPWKFNAFQCLLLLITVLAAAALFGVLKGGLLGYPNLLIQGNGSSAFLLRWYQDRVGETMPLASFVSIPVEVYRGLMLAWALWLAFSILKWIRWGWGAYSTGAYWKETPAIFRRKAKLPANAPPPPPPGQGEGATPA